MRALHDFDAWIGQFWIEGCPAAQGAVATGLPLGMDDAIVWYETADTVFGFLPGCDGCFSLPRDIPLPDFPFAAGKTSFPFGEDIVISAAMRDELHPSGS